MANWSFHRDLWVLVWQPVMAASLGSIPAVTSCVLQHMHKQHTIELLELRTTQSALCGLLV